MDKGGVMIRIIIGIILGIAGIKTKEYIEQVMFNRYYKNNFLTSTESCNRDALRQMEERLRDKINQEMINEN
jgi:hypothetical protein